MKNFLPSQTVGFTKTNEPFGGFSNMCGGYSITNGLVTFPTSEHLYQICKFTDHPSIQKELLEVSNPMVMKNKSKKFKNFIRKDWEEIKGEVMKWVVKGKFVSNFVKFGNLLVESGIKPIVEVSKKDSYWGMKENNGVLEGWNHLGGILTELRSEIWNSSPQIKEWEVDGNLKLKIFGEWMERVSVEDHIHRVGIRSFDFLMKKHKTGIYSPTSSADILRPDFTIAEHRVAA
jgi:ribA/ribD-fused uncharacterized protein